MSVVLLVEALDGDLLAVRFSTTAAARAWEDRHEDGVYVRGVARVVTQREALAASDPVDTESSASRQHYIETGRYLRVGEAEGVDDPPAADAAASDEHFHGCPDPTGRPFDCDYCQERAASMESVP